MERRKLPFNIGVFGPTKEFESSVRKPDKKDFGNIQVGYFKNIENLCSSLQEAIPVRFNSSIFTSLPLTDGIQNLELVTFPLVPTMKAKGAKSLKEFTYDLVLKIGEENGLIKCPWETSLYYLLQRGSIDLNLFRPSLIFVTEPFVDPNNNNKLCYPHMRRELSFMEFGTMPIENCCNDLTFGNLFIFARKK